MSENILPTDPASLPSGSDLVGGDSSTGDPSEARVGTPKVGGASPSVTPTKFPLLTSILLILLSIVAAISIYLFLQVRTLTLEKTTPSPSPSPIASSDPTAGWQTYSDSQNNYTFNYPGNFRIIAKGGSHYLLPIDSSDDTQPPIIFNTYDNPKNLSIPEFVEEAGKDGPSPSFYTVNSFEKIVDNVKGYYDENTGCEPVLCDKFTMTYNKKIYEFASLYFNDPGQSTDPSQREIFKQILSTFKFTDSEKSNLPKKHYLSSDKFFDTRTYPAELTSLKDTDLTGFTCSEKYTKRENDEYIFRKEGWGEGSGYEDTKLTDKPFLEYLLAKGAGEAVVCKTDTGKILLSYGIFGNGGGVGSTTYYGYFEGDNTAVATVPMENGPYFSCGTILAITQSNTLYVECGSGDGGFGSKSLYKVGLYKAYTSDLLLKCTTIMQDENSTPKITCGTTQ